MKFGHIFMNYYPENSSDCTGPYRQVVYSIENEEKLYFLQLNIPLTKILIIFYSNKLNIQYTIYIILFNIL